MDFIAKSGGVYKPIKDLFDTHMYEWTLKLCWSLRSYKSQIAVLVELLKLQQKKQIPSEVTAEEMTEYIFQRSKNAQRESLWEFDLKDLDENDDKSLLMLVWAVNMSNKMRDVEFEAKMLLRFPEAIPQKFLHPQVMSTANEFVKFLQEKQQVASSSKRLSPQEVVILVVPRVLHGLWRLPPRPLLQRPSKMLSELSVGVTKATMDRLSSALKSVENQATFSRCIRNTLVRSILTEIRRMYHLAILVDSIRCFAPELLGKIVDVAEAHICEMFQPHSAKVPVKGTSASGPVQDYIGADETEQQQTPGPDTNCHMVSPTTPKTNNNEIRESCADEYLKSTSEKDSAKDSPTPSTSCARPASFPDIQADENGFQESCADGISKSRREKPVVASPAPPSPRLEQLISYRPLRNPEDQGEEKSRLLLTVNRCVTK